MRITVIETGHLKEPLASRWGSFPEMFRKLWARPGDTWQTWDCVHNDPPEDLFEQDAILITGSAANAHDPDPWIVRLKETIVALHEKRVKILGICFGHQVIAGALGGRSGPSDQSWELGMHPITLNHTYREMPWGSDDEEIHVLDVHRDHVMEMPPGATLLASSEHTHVHMYCMDNLLCMQSHPEFDKAFLEDLIEVFHQERGFSPELKSASLASLQTDHHNARARALVYRFLYDEPAPAY